jgi:hypothetical protein
MARIRAFQAPNVGIRLRSAVLAADPEPTPSHYAAALLKVAIRLRKSGVPDLHDLDDLLEEVLGDLPVDRPTFRGYVQRNRSFLLAALGQTHT